MTDRQELPTALPYVTLRNWHEVQMQSKDEMWLDHKGATQFYDEPCLVHVDYPTFLGVILRRIDGHGRVHTLDLSMDREVISSPIPTCDLSQADPDERNRAIKYLAQHIFETMGEIIQYSGHMGAAAGQDVEEVNAVRVYEGYLAGLMAPYHDDQELLVAAVTLAERAQAEGCLTVSGIDAGYPDISVLQRI